MCKLECALLVWLTLLFLGSCKQGSSEVTSNENALFRQLSSQESGINFSNTLHESDSFNAIFYEFFYNGSGVAIGDVNNDGLSDIFFGGNRVASRLYLNKGHLIFEDITESAGIHTAGKWVTGVNMTDINQDGNLDIYVCVGGNIHQDYHNLLFINISTESQVAFTESAAAVGLDDDGYSTQSAFFDYDGDGDLDMYLLTSAMNIPNKNAIRERKNDGSVSNTDRFYRNDGLDASTGLPVFHEVSREAGITWDGFGLGLVVCDINKDNWPDVYVANDYISNDLLYVNQGNGRFNEMLQSYFKHSSFSAMGADVADINNDGLIDLFTLDMLPEDYYRKKTMAGNMRGVDRYLIEKQAGYAPQYIRNMLQLNVGSPPPLSLPGAAVDTGIGGGHFSEIGQLAGVHETDWSWVPLLADFDNDGYKDLFIGNGIVRDVTNMDFSSFWMSEVQQNANLKSGELEKALMKELEKKGNVKKPNRIYRNTGHLLFEDKTKAWGLETPSYTTSGAFADLDNDGDLDLVLNNINDPASIYENRLIQKDSVEINTHFLNIQLVGDALNTGGIGAKIDLFYGAQHQYYEHFPVRGFQSMVDPKVHFGLGKVAAVDSLKIIWPDGKAQTLINVKAGQLLKLQYDEAEEQAVLGYDRNQGSELFVNVTKESNIIYQHTEREFVDYKIQPLLPHQYSKEGPGIAVGDINGDRLEDFFVGGAAGYAGQLFLQQKEGTFTATPLPGNQNFEDMGALFFDADNDDDLDLYVVSGGAGLPPGSPYYQDRLYLNDGKGNFTHVVNALPPMNVCGSQVTAADYDKDGDLDLFVGGRLDLENYPLPTRSFLLRNDTPLSPGNAEGREVSFTDVTHEISPSLEKPGLIAAALWTDFDQDGWVDLLLAGEWMPLTFFKNEQGKFVDVTAGTGLEKYTGWWNSLTGADFDKDGDIDYVAGNLGRNTPYRVSQAEPMQIIAKDFDKNGAIDPICCYYIQGKNYPMYNRDLLISQLPGLKKKFTTYDAYATATISDIFSEKEMKDAYISDSRYHESSYIENNGDGTFMLHPLPLEAQFAPVFGLLADDYNNDGHLDVLLAGNSYDVNAEPGQFDASIGLLLAGDGQGNFQPVPGRESGFFVEGDAKGMAALTKSDGSSLVLVAQNSASLQAFSSAGNARNVPLEKEDAAAVLYYESGISERKEFYYGSGYLSQSSRICHVPAGVDSLKIRKYSGETREFFFK